MTKKSLIIIVTALAGILLILLASLLLLGKNNDPDRLESTTAFTAEVTTQPSGETGDATTAHATTDTTAPDPSDTTGPSAPSIGTETTQPLQTQGKDPEQTTAPNTVTDPPAVTTPVTQPQSPQALQFPYKIPGTSLVIEQIESYDGIFLEDGSDSDVSGITVIILTNTGSTCAEYAAITLTQGSRTLNFKATALAAGCTAVVQESGAAAYQTGAYTACTADVAELEKLEMSENLVSVTENANGSLTVKNLTNQEIPCVRIFYKFCMDPGSVYVGGITYTARIVNLKAGASQEVTPSHYAAGYSEVIMVRTYDTVD